MESISSNQVYAVTVWYHPTQREADVIRLYQPNIAGVIVVDNSDEDNSVLLADNPSVIYLPLRANKGIAAALNAGCLKAQELGAVWALTMDQDSRWDQHTVTQYIAEVNACADIEKTAIFSPYHDCDGHPETHHQKGRYQYLHVVMCSGNLLRLSAWKTAGMFDESYFIDIVDDEMCCRLRQNGWFVIRANNILLTHHLGNGVQFVGFTKHQYVAHAAWRYYYIARNIRRTMRRYPEEKKYYRRQVWKYTKRLCLYDWTDKSAKLRSFIQGWCDGRVDPTRIA